MGPGLVIGGLTWAAGLLAWAITGSVLGGIVGGLGFCGVLLYSWGKACNDGVDE